MRLIGTLDRDEDVVWVAGCPSVPGRVREGATGDKALENIREASELCLEGRAAQGLPPTVETQQIEVAIQHGGGPLRPKWGKCGANLRAPRLASGASES